MPYSRILACVTFASFAALSPAPALAQAQTQSTLWLIDADGGDLRPLGETPGFSCGSPDWSPDGNRIAYDTWRLKQTWQESKVAVVRADGTERQILGSGAMPSWSPDNTHIVCHTYGPYSILVMNADGTGREAIAYHWGSPRWSPRGNWIASIGTSGGISLIDLATGREFGILAGPHSPRQGFAISPNGRRICFGDGDQGLSLATLDERTRRAAARRLVISGTCYHCSWSQDGKRVVFSWQPALSVPPQLYILDVDSDAEPSRIEGQESDRSNVNPDWSPDGKTIVFASYAIEKVEASP